MDDSEQLSLLKWGSEVVALIFGIMITSVWRARGELEKLREKDNELESEINIMKVQLEKVADNCQLRSEINALRLQLETAERRKD